MATEIFSKNEFEAALPTHKLTNAALWQSKGLVDGEYVYYVPVNENAGIMIRSSIGASGYAASTGEDSIRLWLSGPDNGDSRAKSCKLDTYTKRTKNWRTTMLDKLRNLYQIGKFVRPCKCGGMVRVSRSSKDNEHKGYLFASCSNHGCHDTRFAWIADPKGNILK